MSQSTSKALQIGYIPLLDCVAILWAKQRGFFEELGLNVELVKEASWASLRDRLSYGFLDAAHCLSAMLPAALISEDQLNIALETSLVLSTNRAFISLSQKLCYELSISETDDLLQASKKIVTAIQNEQPIKLAHVFKHSIHHYCLREWLALTDLDTAKNIQLDTLPPPFMVQAMKNHSIDGFCVGEPWNTQSEILGLSHLIGSSQDIIPSIADKVLAFTSEWAKNHPNEKSALTQAIRKAQIELQHLSDFSEVWKMLTEFNIIQFECSENKYVRKYYSIQKIIQQFVENDATPKVEDFDWLLSQMQKWDNLTLDAAEYKKISHSCIST